MSRPALAAALAALTLGALSLAGCADQGPRAPFDKGVCFHAVPESTTRFRFNPVKSNVQSIEFCAAELEGMRVRFLRMGGQNREIVGAYQGSFLIINPQGIFRRQKWNGAQYLLMVRTGDGRLAQPGAMPSY
jgi:hypothetical protein